MKEHAKTSDASSFHLFEEDDWFLVGGGGVGRRGLSAGGWWGRAAERDVNLQNEVTAGGFANSDGAQWRIPNIRIWKFTDSPTLICRLIRSHPQSHLHPPHLPFLSVSLIPPSALLSLPANLSSPFPSAFACHLVTLPLLSPFSNFPWQVSICVCVSIFCCFCHQQNEIQILPSLKRLTGHH